MTEIDFAEARQQLFALHREGDYAAAMTVAQLAVAQFPDRIDQTTYWVACLHALLGHREQALRTLAEGFARGLWWPPEMLNDDPDLADLRSDDRFRAIVTGSERARASTTAFLPTDPVIRQPQDPPPRAVVVLLHGRGESAEDVVERWIAARQALIVAPRSTQPFGMRLVCWDDPQRAEADVQHAVKVAPSQADLAGLPLLTAGFSQGAGRAIGLAAKRRLPSVTGFIAVAPSTGWAAELIGSEQLTVDGLRGYLMIGALDPQRDGCEQLAQQLRDAGAEIALDVVDGLGHDYPPDFDERLPSYLDWVMRADLKPEAPQDAVE